LNRRAITRQAGCFFNEYGIDWEKDAFVKIKRIRNSLIHTGRFPKNLAGEEIEKERELRALLQRTFLALLGCEFTYSTDQRDLCTSR